MPEPFRIRVLEALEATLKEINPGNGYVHDLSEAVLWGRVEYGRGDPLPMVSMLEPPVPPEWNDAMLNNVWGHGGWPLLLQGFVQDNHGEPTKPAYRLAAEVKRRLAYEKTRMNGQDMLGMGPKTQRGGNAVMDILVGSEVVRPGEEQTAKTFFWLPISIKIVENHAQPYD